MLLRAGLCTISRMRMLAAVLTSLLAMAAHGATFVVSNTADLGAGSLRQAIADANGSPGPDTIDFSIGTGPQTINVASPLTVTSPLVLDGATQEGFGGTPLITLNGTGIGDGLVFAAGADGSIVRNLELGSFYGVGFFDGAAIVISGANGVTVAGNYIGGIRGLVLRNRAGIRIQADGNTIGGLTATDRNLFVNETTDVEMSSTASDNVVQGNYFGFDATGLAPLFPATTCVAISGSGNVVGGTEAGARNVLITSAAGIGIGNGAQNNRVEGNYIGLNANGLAAAPFFPSTTGIVLSMTGGGNVIGGATAAARNVIANNAQGISIAFPAGADSIHGNFIGTDPSGLTAIPNELGMIVAASSASAAIVIGGTGPGEGNLISGNTQYGLYLSAPTAVLQGNYIGTDGTGLAALPNGQSGVHLQNHGATIGTGAAAGRNVISGNGGSGIEGSSLLFAAGHAIAGNFIGVGADGVTPLSNGGNGIELGTTSGASPIIRSNVIGHNALAGILLASARDVVVGGSAATANRIFTNGGDGVAITGTAVRNVVTANSIDFNAGLGIDLANDGVTLNDAADADDGPNRLQNHPALTRAITSTGLTVVTGTLSSTPATSFSIDFYASPSADPSGHGEGAQHLGTAAVVTDAGGQATINATVAATPPGRWITATATATASGTSEFSNAVAAEAGGTLQFSSATYSTPEGSVATITVTRTGGTAGTVTVDYSTADGTATAGQDYTAAGGRLTFLDGQASVTFTISTAPDTLIEGNETVLLTLSNAGGGAALGTPSAASLTINEAAAPVPTLGELALLALAVLLALVAVQALRWS